MRRKVLGSDRHWASVAPPGYEGLLHRSSFEQIAWQVMTIERYIEEVSKKDHIKNLLCVRYESLCERPLELLSLIGSFYQRTTGLILRKKPSSVPVLCNGNQKRIASTEWELLTGAVERQYGLPSCHNSS
jgi:hypothetical protein